MKTAKERFSSVGGLVASDYIVGDNLYSSLHEAILNSLDYIREGRGGLQR